MELPDSQEHLVSQVQKEIKVRHLEFPVAQDPRDNLGSLVLKARKEQMDSLVMWVSQEAKVKMGMLVFLEMLAFLAPQDSLGLQA